MARKLVNFTRSDLNTGRIQLCFSPNLEPGTRSAIPSPWAILAGRLLPFMRRYRVPSLTPALRRIASPTYALTPACTFHKLAYRPLLVINSSWLPVSVTRPCSSTYIRLALTIVDRRWATTSVVRPRVMTCMERWMAASVSLSDADFSYRNIYTNLGMA